MISAASVRKAALSLPEAVEQDHWGRPSFRVRKRIFAVLRESERRAVLKLPLEDQHALVAADPDVFSVAEWGHQGWTFVELRKVKAELFRDVLSDAWRSVAPKRVVAAYDLDP